MKMVPIAGLASALALVGGLVFYVSRHDSGPAQGAQAPANVPATSDSQPREQPAPLTVEPKTTAQAGQAEDATRRDVSLAPEGVSVDPLPDDEEVNFADHTDLLELAIGEPAAFDAKSRDWGQRELKSNLEALNAILLVQIEGKLPDGVRQLKPQQIEALTQSVGALASRVVH